MAALMTGIGREIIAQQDADLYAGIIGNNLYVLGVGGKMEASIIDNNHVRITNGIAVKEGRAINIEDGSYDDFEIQNGKQGVTSTKYIGYRIYTDQDGEEKIESVVSSSKTETAGLRAGASSMYLWMYEVKQNGIILESVSKLFEEQIALAQMPVIRYGTADPDNNVGKDGDIYIKVV